jgi:hypothetical protein
MMDFAFIVTVFAGLQIRSFAALAGALGRLLGLLVVATRVRLAMPRS